MTHGYFFYQQEALVKLDAAEQPLKEHIATSAHTHQLHMRHVFCYGHVYGLFMQKP